MNANQYLEKAKIVIPFNGLFFQAQGNFPVCLKYSICKFQQKKKTINTLLNQSLYCIFAFGYPPALLYAFALDQRRMTSAYFAAPGSGSNPGQQSAYFGVGGTQQDNAAKVPQNTAQELLRLVIQVSSLLSSLI